MCCDETETDLVVPVLQELSLDRLGMICSTRETTVHSITPQRMELHLIRTLSHSGCGLDTRLGTSLIRTPRNEDTAFAVVIVPIPILYSHALVHFYLLQTSSPLIL